MKSKKERGGRKGVSKMNEGKEKRQDRKKDDFCFSSFINFL
jgi:hypothetical protein